MSPVMDPVMSPLMDPVMSPLMDPVMSPLMDPLGSRLLADWERIGSRSPLYCLIGLERSHDFWGSSRELIGRGSGAVLLSILSL